VARQRKKLALGKGAAFVKGRLKRLPQEGESWEADFRALPKPLSQNETHYLGLVVVQGEGSVLAEEQVEGTPDVNDLATLLAHAMRRPLTGSGYRPKRVRVRKNPRWPELFPHLAEVGVKAVVDSDLDTLRAAFHEHLRRVHEARRARMVKPTAEQASVEKLFPAVAQWVRGGHIEVGDQEGFGFVARALDYGGLTFEDDRPNTLAEALAALEKGLRGWYEEQGMEVDGAEMDGSQGEGGRNGPAARGRQINEID
jgi:hypothetical protein